jgi:D-aminopeptidase
MNLTAYLTAAGRFEEARMHAREVLVLTRESGNENYCSVTLQHVAAIVAGRSTHNGVVLGEDQVRAAQLLGYVDAALAKIGMHRQETERREYAEIVQALSTALGPRHFQEQMAIGGKWSEDEAVSEALRI